MLLLTNTGLLINVEHVRDIYVENDKIYAEFDDNSELLLGEYENPEEILEKIGECYGAVKFLRLPGGFGGKIE